MKKILGITAAAAIAGAMLLAAPAQAKNYGMAGCGLGSMIITDNNILQIFAATSNGTSGNQTFGITTGTSNCTGDSSAYLEKQQELYVEVNYEGIQQQLVSGGGEKVNAFATIMGCSNKAEFTRALRSGEYFDGKATPSEVLKQVRSELNKDSSLSKACKIEA
ncbi:MAG: DUF3015 family protein [Leptospiraceae bacterium]|nr:DUF3015 family protein [Leptospiraceae bacterium]